MTGQQVSAVQGVDNLMIRLWATIIKCTFVCFLLLRLTPTSDGI
jgi:hypothetical protein